jgi:hypothetical protein
MSVPSASAARRAVRWVAREPPLAVEAVIALGEVVTRWVAAWGEVAPGVETVRGPGVLVVWSPEVPWVDGLRYVGRAPEHPGVWWPCALRPELAEGLVVAAARRGWGATAPVAIVPEGVVDLRARWPADAPWDADAWERP